MSKWGEGWSTSVSATASSRKGKEKEIGSLINRIMTVPHCYPSVVHNTLEMITHRISEVRVIVHVVVDTMGATTMMRSGVQVDMTGGTEVTVIVTMSVGVMADDTVIEAMRGMGDSIPLINIREAASTR